MAFVTRDILLCMPGVSYGFEHEINMLRSFDCPLVMRLLIF